MSYSKYCQQLAWKFIIVILYENESDESKKYDINEDYGTLWCIYFYFCVSLLLIKIARKYTNHTVITM